jgi:hypothetical protein
MIIVFILSFILFTVGRIESEKTFEGDQPVNSLSIREAVFAKV